MPLPPALRPALLALALAPVLLGFLAAPAARAEGDGDGETLYRLSTGRHQLRARVVGSRDRFLLVDVGGRTYEFEPGSLGETGGDVPATRAGWQELVADLAPRLASADPALARAARAGLRALGPDVVPWLRRLALATPHEPIAAALEALADEMEGGSGDR